MFQSSKKISRRRKTWWYFQFSLKKSLIISFYKVKEKEFQASLNPKNVLPLPWTERFWKTCSIPQLLVYGRSQPALRSYANFARVT